MSRVQSPSPTPITSFSYARPWPSSLPDAVDFFLESECVQALHRQGEKKTDSAVQRHIRISESALHNFRFPNHSCRVWNAPVRRHRLTRPDRADFLGCVVAHREDEIEMRRCRFGKLIPVLAAKAI